MEQNKFEKNIQKKLDELNIHPSESAWLNIEKRISNKGKQRKMAFILFFLCLFFLTGGYWLFNSGKIIKKPQDNYFRQSIKNNSEKVTDKKRDSSYNKSAIAAEKNTDTVGFKIPKIISSSDTTIAKNKSIKQPGFSNGSLVKSPRQNIFSSKEKIGKLPTFGEGANEKIKRNNFHDKKKEVAKNDVEINIELKKPFDEKLEKDSMKNTFGLKKIIEKTDSAILNKKPEIQVVRNHYKKWNLGIEFSGGSSFVADDPLGINNSANYYLSTPSNSSGGTGSYTNFPSSKTRSSVAFIVGAFLEKNISPEHKISFGINYKYFSTSNKIGNKIDSAQTAYYAANSTHNYRSNFSYLELPVSLKLQLGKNKYLPVYWQFGINISQLISSNALQFKSNPSLYYNDNSLFNKTQFGFSTSISAFLFAKQKTSIAIGPYFYYGASRLAGKGLYQKKHFNFIGLRSEILFLKK